MSDPKDHPKSPICGAHPSRRTVLQAGAAGVAAAGLTATGLALSAIEARAQISGVGVAEGTLPGRTAPFTLEGTSSAASPRLRAGIDIHAHYYPEEYLEVLAQGKAFGADYTQMPEGYMLKAPGFSGGPFPAKFTDLKLRLADMDAQGVRVHALSLTRPMPYFGPADYALKLARAFNDGAARAAARTTALAPRNATVQSPECLLDSSGALFELIC